MPLLKKGKEEFNLILVIVNRFIKMAIYVPTKKTLKAAELIDILVKLLISYIGVPKSIISDRGALFTSLFWQEFCAAL